MRSTGVMNSLFEPFFNFLFLIQPLLSTAIVFNSIFLSRIQIVTSALHYSPIKFIRPIVIQFLATFIISANHLFNMFIPSIFNINGLSNIANIFIFLQYQPINASNINSATSFLNLRQPHLLPLNGSQFFLQFWIQPTYFGNSRYKTLFTII